MRKLREYFDIGFAVLWERKKPVLAIVGVISIAAVSVGVLLAAGVFDGGRPLDEPGPQTVVAEVKIEPSVPSVPEAAVDLAPEPPAVLDPTPYPTVSALRGSGTDLNEDPAPVLPIRKDVQVPINLLSASDLGSLEFVLVYEPATMEFVGIDHGVLAPDSLIESNLRAPGKVWFGIIDSQGVTGDGSIAVVSFRTVEGGQADSPLYLEDISSHHAKTLLDAPSRSTPGMLTAKDGWFSSPSLVFE